MPTHRQAQYEYKCKYEYLPTGSFRTSAHRKRYFDKYSRIQKVQHCVCATITILITLENQLICVSYNFLVEVGTLYILYGGASVTHPSIYL